MIFLCLYPIMAEASIKGKTFHFSNKNGITAFCAHKPPTIYKGKVLMLFNIFPKLCCRGYLLTLKRSLWPNTFFKRFRLDPMFNFVNSIHCCQRICLNKQFCFSLKTFLFKQALLRKVMTFLFGRETVFFGRLLWIFFCSVLFLEKVFWQKFLKQKTF